MTADSLGSAVTELGGDAMSAFTIKVPKKRERNALVLAQAMGLAPVGRPMRDKRRKKDKHRRDWREED